MELVNNRELRKQVQSEGAYKTAEKLTEAIGKGDLTYRDFSIRALWDNFVTNKSDDKDVAGSKLIEEKLSEDSASQTDAGAFALITSQIFFNALTTKYRSADFTISNKFKVIPSTLPRGEKFGGISNVATLLEPVNYGRDLPHLEPTEDFSESPPMQRKGAIVDLTIDMVRADRTGEVTNIFENLGVCAGVNEELEAVQTLADLALTTGANYSRTHYKWKNVLYNTYQTSTPWVNVVTSNGLVDHNNVNNAYVQLSTILDPYTGFPTVLGPGPISLVVTPQLLYTAKRIARSTQFRTGTSSSSNDILITDGFPPVEFDVVESKYLKYLNDNSNSTGLNTTWFFGQLSEAFSWQRMMDITMSEALPGSYSMWSRGLTASYKFELIQTSYAFNPRYVIKNTA